PPAGCLPGYPPAGVARTEAEQGLRGQQPLAVLRSVSAQSCVAATAAHPAVEPAPRNARRDSGPRAGVIERCTVAGGWPSVVGQSGGGGTAHRRAGFAVPGPAADGPGAVAEHAAGHHAAAPASSTRADD